MPKPTPPSDAIDKDKMVNILADIHLAESKINRMNFSGGDSAKVAYTTLEHRIFKKYGVDSAKYVKTYQFYAINPDLMTLLYDDVIKKIEEKKKKNKLD